MSFSSIGILSTIFALIGIILVILSIIERRKSTNALQLQRQYLHNRSEMYKHLISSCEYLLKFGDCTKPCFRALWTADRKFGWRNMPRVIVIALHSNRLDLWKELDEFIYCASTDEIFTNQFWVENNLKEYGIDYHLDELPIADMGEWIDNYLESKSIDKTELIKSIKFVYDIKVRDKKGTIINVFRREIELGEERLTLPVSKMKFPTNCTNQDALRLINNAADFKKRKEMILP